MRIREIDCKVMNISQYSNWIFFVMKTDCEIEGYGEATLDGQENQIFTFLKSVKAEFIGKNPLDEKLHQMVKPKNLVEAAAMSAIDLCLWDIRGKAEGIPVYKLLGEKKHERVPVYATFNRALKRRTLEEFAEVSEGLVDKGLKGIKCAPFDDFTWQNANKESERYIERGIQRIAAVREAVGKDIDLRVDCHWRFNMDYAVRVARCLKPYHLYWFEAPISEKSGYDIASLREKIGLRIAGAEMQYDFAQLDTLYRNDALDVYMFDIKYIGGITGLLKQNETVKRMKRKIAPHNMTGPIATAASLHACAVCENLDSLEMHFGENEQISALSDLDLRIETGAVSVPEEPGLGVTLNFDMIEKNPYKPTVSFRANMLGA